MSFWDLIIGEPTTFPSLKNAIPRAGYLTVEKPEEPPITFEEIQGSIKDELVKIGEKIEGISEQDLKIQELKTQLENFKLSNKEIYDKINNLESVGLVSTPSSSDLLSKLRARENNINSKIRVIEDEIKALENIDKLTKKYSLKYPSFKFIDTNTFTNILKKYHLVLGDSSLYCKEIPDNVLTNILKFEKEIKSSRKYVNLFHYHMNVHRSFNTEHYILNIVEDSGYDEYFFRQEVNKKDYHNNISHIQRLCHYQKSDFVIAAPINHFKNQIFKAGVISNEGKHTEKEVKIFTVDKNTREFSININYLKNLAESNNEIIRKLEDPIACLKVEGGVIIIDAWDKEALIPEISRETLN